MWTSDAPFLAACRGERPSHRPVWFMRQAGRSLPEYKKAKGDVPILDALRQPELAAEITLQPVRRHGVDAAVLYSDIMAPVHVLGFGVEIKAGVGPVVADPFRSAADLARLRPLVPEEDCPWEAETIGAIAEASPVPLIGFAGAPFTVASYLVEGGPSREQTRTRTLMLSEPDLWARLADRLADIALASLRSQVAAGAAAIQLFDSWVGTLSPAAYRQHVLPATKKIFDGLADLGVPRIHFGVNTGELLPLMAESGADVVGVDWRTPLDVAATRVPAGAVLQGNLDPITLLAPWAVTEGATREVLAAGDAVITNEGGHIFNLGHGVLPETDPTVLTRVVERARVAVTARPTVVVVGAGIAGLAAALAASEAGADVTLVEAQDRVGGNFRTEPFAGRPLDNGADAFLARRPEAVGLAKAIGMGDELIAPSSGSAWLYSGGVLRALPDGLVLGVPSDLRALTRSRVLSPLGTARVALDLLGRRGPVPGQDVAVGRLATERLGREAADRLIDPLLGGINAGSADALSLHAGVPQLAAAFTGQRSLVAGARKQRRAGAKATKKSGAPPPSVFLAPQGGMTKLTDRLLRHLVDRGVTVNMGWDVAQLRPRFESGPMGKAGGWSVVSVGGLPIHCDAVVVALPPGPAAALLEQVAPTSAAQLGAIRQASVTMTCLAYPKDTMGNPLEGSGFLVPRRDGTLMTACTWASSKWKGTTDPDLAVLRVSSGRFGDDRAMRLTEDELVRRLHREVAEALDIEDGTAPAAVRVTRWHDGFPQYEVDHADLVGRIQAGLPAGVEVAGAAYEGVGIPACIGSGQSAAARAVATATGVVSRTRRG